MGIMKWHFSNNNVVLQYTTLVEETRKRIDNYLTDYQFMVLTPTERYNYIDTIIKELANFCKARDTLLDNGICINGEDITFRLNELENEIRTHKAMLYRIQKEKHVYNKTLFSLYCKGYYWLKKFKYFNNN